MPLVSLPLLPLLEAHRSPQVRLQHVWHMHNLLVFFFRAFPSLLAQRRHFESQLTGVRPFPVITGVSLSKSSLPRRHLAHLPPFSLASGQTLPMTVAVTLAKRLLPSPRAGKSAKKGCKSGPRLCACDLTFCSVIEPSRDNPTKGPVKPKRSAPHPLK